MNCFDGRFATPLLTCVLWLALAFPATAQRPANCVVNIENDMVGSVDFGDSFAAIATAPMTCTASMRVAKGTPFVTAGIVEVYDYITDTDGTFCGFLSCGPATQTLTLTGPSGVLYSYPAPDLGRINVPPTGPDWVFDKTRTTICFDGSCGDDFGRLGFPKKLGTHTLAQARKSTSLFFDTAEMAKNGDVTLTWTYSLNASDTWLPITLSLDFQTPVYFHLFQDRNYSDSYRFRPRDARDGVIANCASFPDDCHPAFKLSGNFINPPLWFSEYAALDITAEIKLKPPAFRTKWLHGTSTNYGNDTDAAGNDLPDYLFETSLNPTLRAPSADGLTISSPIINGQSSQFFQPVIVTSHDYGGAANIEANIIVNYKGKRYTYPVPPSILAQHTKPIGLHPPARATVSLSRFHWTKIATESPIGGKVSTPVPPADTWMQRRITRRDSAMG